MCRAGGISSRTCSCIWRVFKYSMASSSTEALSTLKKNSRVPLQKKKKKKQEKEERAANPWRCLATPQGKHEKFERKRGKIPSPYLVAVGNKFL